MIGQDQAADGKINAKSAHKAINLKLELRHFRMMHQERFRHFIGSTDFLKSARATKLRAADIPRFKFCGATLRVLAATQSPESWERGAPLRHLGLTVIFTWTMKPARGLFDSNRRPRWWAAFLSLLVALALVAQPACLCAMESASAHHHAAAQQHAPSVEHDAAHHDLQNAHSASTRAAFSATHQAHFCCCDNSPPPAVAISVPRIAAPQDGILLISAPAILPAAQEIFAFTNCHGRDGPTPAPPLFSQFFGSSFSSRAPPVFA